MLRKLFIGAGVLVAVLAIAAVALVTLVDVNRFKPEIQRFVQDRYQRSLGLPQWYGTQRIVVNGREYLQPIDTTKVTDAERQAYFVGTLPQKLADFNKQNGKAESSITKYVLTDEQHRTLAQQRQGVELVGNYEALFRQAAYPAQARAKNVAGFVLIEATVDAKGAVSRADVV
jgi:hypothetical protein